MQIWSRIINSGPIDLAMLKASMPLMVHIRLIADLYINYSLPKELHMCHERHLGLDQHVPHS